MPLVAPPVRGFALVALPQLGDEYLCGNQIFGAFVLNRRVDHHAIDATAARWCGDAGSSPLDGASAAT